MAEPLEEMHEATAVKERLDDLDAFESGQIDPQNADDSYEL